MENKIELIILYDYYGELLTDNQQLYFKCYYFDNMTLQEISDNLLVSRNAVHKQLKVVVEKLNYYENILHLYEKDKKLREIVNKMSDNKIKKEINKIIEMGD